jgi:hypothetical protein
MIQIVPHMSDLRGLTWGEWNSLVELVLCNTLFSQKNKTTRNYLFK